MEHINQAFYRAACAVNRELPQLSWKKVLYPDTHYITEGDQFFRSVWRAIDQSKSYVWILTYAMDKSIPANTTMIKLIEARKRGVNTVLFVDDLQQWVDPSLLKQYVSVGGTYESLNPQWKLKSLRKFHNKEIFRRHHEKMLLSDHRSILGSSNLETGYASTKFGSRVFRDFNFSSENINLEEQRRYFGSIADMYNIQLQAGRSNDGVLDELDNRYPNSAFYDPSRFRFLRSHQPNLTEIQEEVLNNINRSTKSILVVQPYYYPISSFERAITSALERGVDVELITSAKRDQPVYKHIKNGLLLRRLIKKGLKVYESHEKILHTKAYIFDKEVMTIGSFNNDRWSWKINNETNISIHSAEEYRKAQHYFQDLKKRCQPVDLSPEIGFGRRLKMIFWERFLYLSEVVMSKTKLFDFKSFLYKSPMSAPDEEDI